MRLTSNVDFDGLAKLEVWAARIVVFFFLGEVIGSTKSTKSVSHEILITFSGMVPLRVGFFTTLVLLRKAVDSGSVSRPRGMWIPDSTDVPISDSSGCDSPDCC
jgi:hypothetical protein